MIMLYIFFAHYVVWPLPSPGLTTILVLRLKVETAWNKAKSDSTKQYGLLSMCMTLKLICTVVSWVWPVTLSNWYAPTGNMQCT